jgi:predicted MFS family arabinose efflux permease
MRIAMMNTGVASMNALGPLLGGLIAHTLGFTAVFSASALMLTISFSIVLFAVAEPRARGLFH